MTAETGTDRVIPRRPPGVRSRTIYADPRHYAKNPDLCLLPDGRLLCTFMQGDQHIPFEYSRVVLLESADVHKRSEVTLRRAAAGPVREVTAVEALVANDDERLDQQAALAQAVRNAPRQHVHALDDHGLRLVGRALDDRRDARRDVLRLVGVALDPTRIEGGEVHRRHCLDREEGT